MVSDAPEPRRVCVLGCGLFSSVGDNVDETWTALARGDVGLRSVPAHLAPYVRSRSAHTVPVASAGDRLLTIAVSAAEEALRDAGVQRVDMLAIGSSSASFSQVENYLIRGASAPPERLRPSWLGAELARLVGVPADGVVQHSQACAASSYAIAAGADLIRQELANVVLVGGADELTAAVMAGFESCRIHASVCRPFDVRRSGLVLGEAAAFLVLADEAWARSRGRKPRAHLRGVGLTTDAHDPLSPHPDGEGVQRAIAAALERLPNCDIGLVCAHGTGTVLNDATEARAITQYFAGGVVPPVTSYKGSLGHPQGASGACGAVLAVNALRRGVMFPNSGLEQLDTSLGLDVVASARRAEMRSVLCLSSGSWGANAALVFTRELEVTPA
jgi:3-oxoacyl-[acyl-carrier-protein] synthase II